MAINRPDRDHDKRGLNDETAQLAATMGHHQFTGRAGDFKTEVTRNTGWNYLGITAVAKMASRASFEIYDDREQDAKNRNMRASLRLSHGTQWKSFASDDEKRVADAAFRWWKLIDQPSPWQTGRQLRWDVVQQLHLHGTAMVWNVKNGFNKTLWRIPIPMNLVTPIAPGMRKEYPFGGIKVHSLQWLSAYFPDSGLQQSRYHYVANREISLEDITMYAYPHPLLRGDGYSPTSAGEGWLHLVQQTEDAQSQQYADGPTQKVLVQPLEEDITTNKDLDSFQKRMDRRLRSSETGFIAIPNGGAQPISFAPDSMGYTQTSESMSAAIMALHGTPKTAVGMMDGMTYGSIAASMQGFTSLSVQSDLDLMADEDTATMRKEEGSAFSIEYTAPTYNDPDLKERQLTSDMQAGTITAGEWRRERNREPFGDERDDMICGSQGLKEYGSQDPMGGGMDPMAGMGGMPGMDAMGGMGGPAPAEEDPWAMLDSIGIDGPGEPDGGEPSQWEGSEAVPDMMPQAKSLMGNPVTPVVAAFDLDGSLASGEGDEIGSLNDCTCEIANILHGAGIKIVIYSYRDDNDEIAYWLDKNGVKWDHINDNPYGMSGDEEIIISEPVESDTETFIVKNVMKSLTGNEELKAAVRGAALRKEGASDTPTGEILVDVSGEMAEQVNAIRSSLSSIGGEGEIDYCPDCAISITDGILENNPAEMVNRLRGINQFPYATSSNISVSDNPHGPALVYIEVEGDGATGACGAVNSDVARFGTDPPDCPHIKLAYVRQEDKHLYDGAKVRQLSSVAKKLKYQHPAHPELQVPLK